MEEEEKDGHEKHEEKYQGIRILRGVKMRRR